MDYTVNPIEGLELSDQLHDAVKYIHGTYQEAELPELGEGDVYKRQRLREITDGIEQGIKELFESEKYMRYLSVMSRFHRYSVNNLSLIHI